jgi:RNA polymerase sigma factor (sigma-70 family)
MTVPLDLDVFCHEQYPRLVGTLTLVFGDRGLAQELAQEALARACADWRRVREMYAPGPWLNRVAMNLGRSHFRRRAIERRAADRLRITEESYEPHDDTLLALRAAVAALPIRQRTALVLRFYADFSVEQTAVAMNVPEGTVKRLTHQAVQRLRTDARVRDLVEVHDDA